MSGEVLIKAEHVGKKFCRDLKTSLWYGVKDVAADLIGLGSACDVLRPKEFWALEDISFEVKRGECLGLIGRNGAGKTTLLKMLNGLIKPDRGRIEMHGRVGALIALGAGFNPLLTGRENVYINGAVLGLGKKEIDRKFDEIVDFAELDQFIDSPVQSYSSGMQVRLGFAVATAHTADIILLDEVLAVGDANFQAKCFRRIGEIIEDTAVILVSHQAFHIKKICDHAIWLADGGVAARGNPEQVFTHYNSAANTSPEALYILDNGVRIDRVALLSDCALPGSNIQFEVDFHSEREIVCGQIYINLSGPDGEVFAQSHIAEESIKLLMGGNNVKFSIGPLFLPEGKYFVNLIMHSNGGKATVAHLRNCVTFESRGPFRTGPSNYPPCQTVVSRYEGNQVGASLNLGNADQNL